MKQKQILAKAITLGLLLAMPYSAWAAEITGSENLDSAITYYDGLSVTTSGSIDGGNNNITVSGTLANEEYGVINQGTIKNVGTLHTDSVWNQGDLEVKDLQTTVGEFVNYGKDAVATISGGILAGGIVNDEGATLNINGDVSLIKDRENNYWDTLNNYNGAIINIADEVTVEMGSFCNGSKIGTNNTLGGTINAGGATLKMYEKSKPGGYNVFDNVGKLEVKNIISEISGIYNYSNAEMVINGILTVANDHYISSGIYNYGKMTFTGNSTSVEVYESEYNNAKYTFTNYGTVYVNSGELNLNNVRLTLSENTATLKKNENENLNTLTINTVLSLNKEANLEVNEKIKAVEVNNNSGQIKAQTLEVASLVNKSVVPKFTESKVEVDKLVFSDKVSNEDITKTKLKGGTIIVHESMEYNGEDSGQVENYGQLIFDNEQGGTIGSNIVVENKVSAVSSVEHVGLIAKNTDGDKITSLTIEGTLNNSGIVAAETLNVAKGADAVNSKGFDVDNLNILDGGSFALNNTEYALQNVGVGTNAELTAAGAVNGVGSVALADAATFATQSLSMTDSGTVTSDGGSLTTDAMSGKGLTFNLQSGKEKQINIIKEFTGGDLQINVTSLTPDQVVIGKMNGSGIIINGNSDVTDSFESDNIEAGLQSLAYTASINEQDGDQSRKVTSAAGKILGPTEAMTDANNKIIKSSVKEDVNPANQGISEMASIALMTWRQENNDMNKRLGELRDSAGEHGVWVRMTRGEAKYGNQNIKNQYNAYQLGYDEKLSVDKHWTVGAALTYTDAESSFSYGKGENKHKGLAIYGSRLNDDGSFIDLIARYARLEHEYEVYGGAGKGDFDTNGYSLSAEYGKRFTQDNGLWIEPQVELTYGRVSSGEYLTNNGVRVRQEGMDSLVGRLGFALGKNLAQGKGNVYLRASYLYDFDGETDVCYSYDRQDKRFEQDLGGGWWEVGVGTNINLSEASHLYFDVEKTYGGDVATPWQWNAGVRWSF